MRAFFFYYFILFWRKFDAIYVSPRLIENHHNQQVTFLCHFKEQVGKRDFILTDYFDKQFFYDDYIKVTQMILFDETTLVQATMPIFTH